MGYKIKTDHSKMEKAAEVIETYVGNMDTKMSNADRAVLMMQSNWKGVDAGSFWSVMQNAVSWSYDILNGFIKSVFFAIAVVWIALFNGYDCIPTSEGISQATTRTVVHASLVVLGLDFILTAIMFGAG